MSLLTDRFRLYVKPNGVDDAFRHWTADWGPATDVAGYNCTVARYDDGSLLVTPTNNTLPMTIAMSLELQDHYGGDYASVRVDTRYNTAIQSASVAWVENVNGVAYGPASSGASAPNPAGYVAQQLVFHRGVPAAGVGQRRLQVRITFTRTGASNLGTVKIMGDPAGIPIGSVTPTLSRLYVSPSQYMVETPVLSAAATNVTGDSISIIASRGVSLKGAIDELDPGVLKAIVKGVTYDPRLNAALRPGAKVWLVARDTTTSTYWRCVWSGKVQNADVSYDDAETKVTIEATDLTADLANTPAPQAWGRYDAVTGADAGGTVRAATRFIKLLTNYAPRVYYTTTDSDAASAGDSNPQLLDKDDSASLIEQWQRVRDTSRGLLWIGKGDAWVVTAGPPVVTDPTIAPTQRAYFRAGNSVPAVAPYTFTDIPADPGLKFTGIKYSFSSRALLNSVSPKVHQVNVDTTYGPYRNLNSATQWGAQDDDVTLHELTGWAGPLGAAPDAGVTAADFLKRFATPIRYPSQLTVNVTEDLTPAIVSDIYDQATVKLAADAPATQTVRVLKITHTITANRKRKERGRWVMQLDTRPDWQTAAVTVTPPNATTDTLAPGSPQGNTDPGAIQPIGKRYLYTNVSPHTNGAAVPWDQPFHAIGVSWDAVNRWFVIPKAGRYFIKAHAGLILSNQYVHLTIVVNGVVYTRQWNYCNGAAGNNAFTEVADVIRCAAGDHVQIIAGSASGANLTTLEGGNDNRASCVVTYLGG